MPEQPKIDVFLSYAVQDKALADGVCALLEGRGYSCWIAPRDIPPGVTWPTAIRDAISRCLVMVLIFTQHANESRQMARELERADHHGVPVLPARFEKVEPAGDLEFFLGNRQWLDAFDGGLTSYGEALVEAVKRLSEGVEGKRGDERNPTPDVVSPVPIAREGRRRIAAVAAMILLGGVYAGYRLWMTMGRAAVMTVQSSAVPPAVTAGSPMRVVVRVASKGEQPVQGALVRIRIMMVATKGSVPADEQRAARVAFRETGGREVSGLTDGDGQYTAVWSCGPCAPAFSLAIEVHKEGFQRAAAGLRLSTTAGAAAMAVRAVATPRVVAAGQRTRVTVGVTAEGAPVVGAKVEISTGGGSFDGRGMETGGVTDNRGQFATTWSCVSCASGYELRVRVSKPGYVAANARLMVNISR
jgi:hypothetical protein